MILLAFEDVTHNPAAEAKPSPSRKESTL
jgi:hypothetical protein